MPAQYWLSGKPFARSELTSAVAGIEPAAIKSRKNRVPFKRLQFFHAVASRPRKTASPTRKTLACRSRNEAGSTMAFMEMRPCGPSDNPLSRSLGRFDREKKVARTGKLTMVAGRKRHHEEAT